MSHPYKSSRVTYYVYVLLGTVVAVAVVIMSASSWLNWRRLQVDEIVRNYHRATLRLCGEIKDEIYYVDSQSFFTMNPLDGGASVNTRTAVALSDPESTHKGSLLTITNHVQEIRAIQDRYSESAFENTVQNVVRLIRRESSSPGEVGESTVEYLALLLIPIHQLERLHLESYRARTDRLNAMTRQNAFIVSLVSIVALSLGLYGGHRSLSTIKEILRDNRKAHRALMESEEKYRHLVENANCVIIRLDPAGRFTFFNAFAQKVFGYTQEEVLGQNVVGTIVPRGGEEEEEFAGLITDIHRAPEKYELLETESVCHDGKRVWIRWAHRAIYDTEDNLVEILGVGQNVTDEKWAEQEAELQREQLVQADKLASLGTLVAGVAHEINNPNSFIMLNVPLLDDIWESALPILDLYREEHGDFSLGSVSYDTTRQRVPQLLAAIGEGSSRIKEIVASLKDFARQGTSEMDKSIDFRDVVHAAITLTRSRVRKVTARFELEIEEELPYIKGNFQRLEQVVINLINNACEALADRDKGISVKLFTSPENGSVILAVCDEGIGIPQDSLKYVRDPFFTTKRSSGGTGLGLAISDGIVRDHGGEMNFRSTPNEGTEVTVILPAIAANQKVEAVK